MIFLLDCYYLSIVSDFTVMCELYKCILNAGNGIHIVSFPSSSYSFFFLVKKLLSKTKPTLLFLRCFLLSSL